MPKRPSFTPIETISGWMVSVPPSMSANGKRERKFFSKDTEAKKFAATLSGQYTRGQRGGIVDAGLARQAAEASEVLAGSGSNVFDAAKAFAEMTVLLEPFGISPLDACKAIAAQHQAQGTAETFRERYDRFRRDNEARWRPRYANDMGKIPQWVGESLMASPCAGLNDAVIEQALRKNGAGAQTTVLARKTRVLAVLHAKTKKPPAGKITIMSPRQCGLMLRACQSPAERWAIGLLLFAGIRPYAEGGNGELGRLDWSDVGAKHITVHPETSKTGTDRHIPVTPRLARVLRGRPTSGTILPPNWQRRIQVIRKLAGIGGEQDITRHTFASNFLVAFGEDATKRAMGHTAGSTVLFTSYRRAVTPEAGHHYFR